MKTDENYKIPKDTRIGHVHLKVADIQHSLDFYCGLIGFELKTSYGTDAAFISAGGYHHHIGLNTWYSKNAEPAPINTPGLFHTAILYPTRKDLAIIFQRLHVAKYRSRTIVVDQANLSVNLFRKDLKFLTPLNLLLKAFMGFSQFFYTSGNIKKLQYYPLPLTLVRG
jgi:catechol-2,3-dioxygenase